MIDLRGRFPAEPADFVARTSKARNDVAAKVDYRNGAFPVSKEFANVWSEFKHLLAEAQYGGKCGFCESRIRAGYPGDVEHFRPKAEVCEPASRGNRLDTTGEPPNRKRGKKTQVPGYWWLAYVWENYVFSCLRCNGWKSNSFPLKKPRSKRSLRPGDEKNEEQMLLNPYHEDPIGHFAWDERGQIDFRSEKGKLTIDRCGLDRESLRLEREMVAKKIQMFVDDLASGNLGPELATKYLLAFCKDEEPYASMARALVAAKLGLATDDVTQLSTGVGP